MEKPRILLIPEKTDIEFEQVFATWTNKGGQIKRLGKYWIKDEGLSHEKIALYGNQTFAYVLAQIYGVTLVSPDDTLIINLDSIWTKRRILLKQIDEMIPEDFPVFIKSVIPKIFPAAVFPDVETFKEATKGLPVNEGILVSEIVSAINAEARCFILNGEVKDIALYQGTADLHAGKLFVESFIEKHLPALPHTVVIDIAYSKPTGWFILEFNACWGAGLNHCNADKVIDCIIEATVNP